ncbi:hypothetical protein [Corynebacterium pygosceleis]|uniref:Secreted protein n=1 Tax=Corynebacterium pygosceleis TaxID=2800406 RepID=A0A9Q4GKT2_9CORY|nr:hypothetical protein [Corynebacterium pygosceleis]MCK7636937.1 hypothetical protein [Corynebacterium pygosceleis]MCK7674411.1 hypothetical protein [Corynebacterium pygosceleis]MCL0120291.1 hypothetical protein [Corynebacterium pygosceleis]MCX7467690.1 hypothetical protein [Corynebacterium pygosceleis]
MKLLSRKSLVSVATVVAISTSGLAAPAVAEEATTTAATTTTATEDNGDTGTPEKDSSSEGSSTEGSSEGSSDDTKTCMKNGKEKPCSTIDYYVSKISGWVKMLTTVASLFTALFAISNAIQKVTKIAG